MRAATSEFGTFLPAAPGDVRFQGVKQPCRRNPETAEVGPIQTSVGLKFRRAVAHPGTLVAFTLDR